MTEPSPRRRLVPILAYASIFVILAIGLVTVLPAGNRLVAAPQVPEAMSVEGAAIECLGAAVVAVQSGAFLDLHAPGDGGLDGSNPGSELVGGRLAPDSGRGQLSGGCSPESEFAGLTAVLHVERATTLGITGRLRVGDRDLDVEMEALDPSTVEQREELVGAELLARILLGVAIIIVTARILGVIFARINQPRVIGEIVAGIILGPSVVGLLFPDVTGFLFPAEVTGVLGILAQFGLIFFMFLIGLELDHKMIRGSGHTAVLISHYSIVIPFVLGMGAALVVYPLVGSGAFTGFALFMGAAMAITAFPVLARILTDTGLHKTRIGALAITCAAVDDLTAWCILAIVVAIVKATGFVDAIQTIVLALVFVTGMLLVVRPLAARILSVHEDRGRLSAPIMSGLLVALFLSAWATEMIGIHAIFGAFMFGAILPRAGSVAVRISERLEDVTVLFLLPVFFAVVGLSTQIGLVSGADLWLLTGLIIAIAILGKIGGSLISGLAAGETFHSSLVIGVLMNARGITEIVILTIGRSLGVISPALFTIMVLMALTTTFMTTPLLSLLIPGERDLWRHEARSSLGGDLGGKKVLVGVTNAVTARRLLQLVTVLRGADGLRPSLILASVVEPPGHETVRANFGPYEASVAKVRSELSELSDELSRAGFEVEVVAGIGTDPAVELSRLASVHQASLILVGSHEAYLGYRPLGGVAGDLLRDAPCDVAVLAGMSVHHESSAGPIGVWYRGEQPDEAPLDMAIAIARGSSTAVRVISPTPVQVSSTDVQVESRLLTEPTVQNALSAIDGTALMVVAPPGVLDGALPALREAVIERASVPVLVVRRMATFGQPSSEPGEMSVGKLSITSGRQSADDTDF
jgi:Kef-type K+ transport system membrane component KefB/nucleotide-binding universal stress UspA family protein